MCSLESGLTRPKCWMMWDTTEGLWEEVHSDDSIQYECVKVCVRVCMKEIESDCCTMSFPWWLGWQHMGSLKAERESEGENSRLSSHCLDRWSLGGGGKWGGWVGPVPPQSSTQLFFFFYRGAIVIFLIEQLKLWNNRAPNRFQSIFTSDVLCAHPFFQDHKESQERDPRGPLALQGPVALQAVMVIQVWGDHQDPKDTATPLNALASLTTDIQVRWKMSQSCMPWDSTLISRNPVHYLLR